MKCHLLFSSIKILPFSLHSTHCWIYSGVLHFRMDSLEDLSSFVKWQGQATLLTNL